MVSRRRCLVATIVAILSAVAAVVVSVSAPPSPAQTRVDNPGRALSKNAGRIVRLEEVLRIRDNGEAVIFRSPRFFKLGADGSLFFVDFAEGDRLYRFGPDGRLLHKLLKKGQGPGECQYVAGFIVADDRVRVLSWVPPKIMDLGLDNGRYLRESRVEENSHGLWFLGTAGGKIYGIRDEVFSSGAMGGSGVFNVPNVVYEISPDFKTWKKIYEFPVRMVLKGSRGAFRLDPIDAAISGTTLYILHTAEYRVTGSISARAPRAGSSPGPMTASKPSPGQARTRSRSQGVDCPTIPTSGTSTRSTPPRAGSGCSPR